MQFIDLGAQRERIADRLKAAIDRVVEDGRYILGPQVAELESRLATYVGVRHCIACANGTDALLLPLYASGIGPGDAVFVPSFTFAATAEVVALAKAEPVFVDVDPDGYNIDIDSLEAAIAMVKAEGRLNPRAIIPVDLFGLAADYAAIMRIAERENLLVIEDAAQAIGAEYKGRRVCSFGEYGCLSFFPSKNLGGFGDAGMVVTRDPSRLDALVKFRNHGMAPAYYHACVGGNFRLDALQATVLLVKLTYLDRWTAQRQENAARYRDLFRASPAAARVGLPVQAPWATRHVQNQFVIRVPAACRQKLWDGLKAANIGCNVYYPVPLHLQECFAPLGGRPGDFPESERAARETLALPIYPELTAAQQQTVVDTVAALLVA
ncbi:MAG: DegT/DnrJ/EryC1/StrS family aminotransferase [Hyphomicrobiales bacterium]|nr:DegT/DnrJ/EryC1/StrS family aminotransferase [Hyphomicrobiales bacterium]